MPHDPGERAESHTAPAASDQDAASPKEPQEVAMATGGPHGRKHLLFDTQLRRDDLVHRKPIRVKRESEDVVCVLVDDAVFAFKNRCPHTGYLLHEGRVRGCVVTCISHLAQFDLRDGHVVTLPMEGRNIETGPLAIYQVVERDGAIFVEIPKE